MSITTKFGTAEISDDGYYRITSVKEGNLNKLLHRLIFEDSHQTKIPDGYIIHHEDGDKLNNNIENLVLMTKSQHAAIHMKMENNHQYKDYPRIIKNGHYNGEQVYAIRYNGKRIMRSIDLMKLKVKLEELIEGDA
jgi:hypothetical protein